MDNTEENTETGQAIVENVFAISGRDLVLILKEGFSGTIRGPGIVRSDRGTSAFAGPEFVDGHAPSGARTSRIAVIAQAADASDLFQAGDVISFVRPS